MFNILKSSNAKPVILFSSVLGKKKTSDGAVLPGKDKPCAAGGAASPPGQDGNSRDGGPDGKPKKGIVFEIRSEDGFHIRCESIEGERKGLIGRSYHVCFQS